MVSELRTMTIHRTVTFRYSNLAIVQNKKTILTDGHGLLDTAASQICYSIVVNQFLNWFTVTVHRTVTVSYSNLAIVQNKKTILTDGLFVLELLARFELATSSLPRMRSTG